MIRAMLGEVGEKGMCFLNRHESIGFLAFFCMCLALLPFLLMGYVCSRFSGK